MWGQEGSLYFKWQVRDSTVTFAHRIKILEEASHEITRWRRFQVERSPRARVQWERIGHVSGTHRRAEGWSKRHLGDV